MASLTDVLNNGLGILDNVASSAGNAAEQVAKIQSAFNGGKNERPESQPTTRPVENVQGPKPQTQSYLLYAGVGLVAITAIYFVFKK